MPGTNASSTSADGSGQKSSARIAVVNAEQHGQRIDNFLLRELKGVPKSKIYRILRSGEVRVNSGRIDPGYRLQSGDKVRIPPLRLGEAAAAPRLSEQTGALLRAAVIYEDAALLALNKPSGLAVHRGSGLAFGVIEALRVLRPELDYLELAHRLDRDTSGCLLLAKTAVALRAVQAALGSAAADKRYLVLVRGRWSYGSREVSVPVRKNSLRGGERMVVVSADGKSARSHFRPVSIGRRASLLDVKIDTGRTHQIRVHAAHLGYPVAGDDKYGDVDFNRALSRLGLDRLFLHAHSLSLDLGAKSVALSAPLDAPLRAVLERLGLD